MESSGIMSTKTAVVTGAGSGIGRATALHLAQKGYEVIAIGRTRSSLLQTASCTQRNESIIPLCADITQEESLQNIFNQIDTLDILVVNAGVCERAATDADNASSVWRRVIDTNLTGSWNTVQAATEHLRKGARVIFVSSGLGKLGRAEYTAYAASKHGMLGMMRCLALEWAPRQIAVNAVCPGWVDTEMALSDLQQSAQKQGTSIDAEGVLATENIPMGRFVAPAEVAALIGWLCSSDAAAITGQACNISGGEFGL